MSDELTYNISISGVEELLAKLNAATQEQVIFQSLKLSGLMIAGWSKENRLSGPRPQYLGVVTGRLRASITAADPEHTGNEYSEKIGTNVEYAAIHEFGGLTGRNHRTLIPPRPFLEPALEDEDNRQKILDILTENINDAISSQ